MGILEDKLKLLPTNPGVYVMLDKNGTIIYIGKAKNLKNRVRQYFFNGVKTEKVMAMVSNIVDFYYIIVPSEIDALSLENNLIKKHKPRYNILLKDDKTYPYLQVNLKEDFPTFKITRRLLKGGKYFGPYMGGINVNDVLETVNLAFGLRPCDKKINVCKKEKVCLNYHIHKCSGACAGLIDKQEYKKRVLDAIDFLEGDTKKVEKLLNEKMLALAEKEEFELALKYKNCISGLEKIKLKRLTSLNKFISADVIAYTSNGIYSTVNLLVVRNGRMLGGKNFSFESMSINSGEGLDEFIRRYYLNNKDLPNEIVLKENLPDNDLTETYIKKETGANIIINVAKQGVRKQLADMAEANAVEHLSTAIDRIKHKDEMTAKSCERLKNVLSLSNYPHRIECYDISNISGVDKVGSMVVFTEGESDKKAYRRFKIKTVEGANDFLSLKEVLKRRLSRLLEGDENFPKPDLIVIDGGKGQLSSVKEVFDEFNVKDIDLISLAEREEEIFTLYSKQSVKLPKSDYALRLLIRARDEAHRFAVSYFGSLHSKRNLSSVLDKVEGLGKVKKDSLLKKFKDIGGIISASKSDLLNTEGIGENLAEKIIDILNKEGLK